MVEFVGVAQFSNEAIERTEFGRQCCFEAKEDFRS